RAERRPSRVFAGWAALVYRHRWASALIGVGIMAALALPALSLHLGEPGASAEATSGPAHNALGTLTAGGIPAGVLTPAEILTTAPAAASSVAAQAAHLPGVYAALGPAGPQWAHGGTALVTVLPSTESSVPAGQATVAALERAFAGAPGVAGVGGDG